MEFIDFADEFPTLGGNTGVCKVCGKTMVNKYWVLCREHRPKIEYKLLAVEGLEQGSDTK